MVDNHRVKAKLMPKPTDTNSKIAGMVKLITKYGPQVNRISRELGVHKETARYWYKGLIRRGYAVSAVPDFSKLGLKRVITYVEFTEDFKPYADAILMAMSELCYLTSFMKGLPEDLYSIHANVPQESTSDWIRFMHALKQRRVFSSVQAFSFDWARVVPMKADSYDFEHDSWQFDWSSKNAMEPGASEFVPSTKSKFDSTDLGLIEQLQIDPGASLIQTGNRLKLNYKTLTWHYRTHVLGHNLLKGHLVNWAGTRYDSGLEKPMHRRHKYMWLELMVVGVTEVERMEIMSKVNKLPFLWFEAGGQNYLAQIAFPMETMTEGLSFVRELTSPVRQKASWHFLDQANALRFSIAPSLYDESAKAWKFDQSELLTRFDRLVLEIKGMTS